MQVLGVEHIDLTASDLEASRAFYDLVLPALGFRLIDHPDYLAWSNAHMGIGLRAAAVPGHETPVDRFKPGLHHLALRAPSRGDVDSLHAFLLHHEVTVLDAPASYPEYGPNYYAVFFADPDGMKLEYVYFPWGYWRKVQTEGSDGRARLEAPAGGDRA